MSKATDAAKTWVEALPKEMQASYAAILANEDAAEKLGNSVLMQADYSRSHQQLTAEREEVETAKKANQAFRAELETWRADNTAKVTKAYKDMEILRNQSTAQAERLKRLKEQYSLSDEDIAVEMAAGGKPASEAASDLSKGKGATSDPNPGYVTTDTLNEYGANTALLAAEFHDIQGEYAELFPGKRLAMTALLKGAAEKGQKLRPYFEAEYKIAERRVELAKQAQDAHDAQIRKEAEESTLARLTSEGYQLPGATGPRGGGSPLLEMSRNGAFKVAADKPVDRDADPDRGVSAAIKSFNSREFESQANAMAGVTP
jgi:hypothetical protein